MFCQSICVTGSNGRTTPVQANSVWPNHVNESLLPSEVENASLKVLCELREQQQIERNDILKEIEKKKVKIRLWFVIVALNPIITSFLISKTTPNKCTC